MGMRRTPTAMLAENIIGSSLEQFVQERRDRGRSWRHIASDIKDATNGQIDVTSETLRVWFAETEVAA